MLRFMSSSRPFLFRATSSATVAPFQSSIISSSCRAFATKASTSTSKKSSTSTSTSTSSSSSKASKAAAQETARALAAQKRQQRKERAERIAQKRAELREKLRERARVRKAKEAEAKARLQARRVAARERRLATVAKARTAAQLARAEKKIKPKLPGSAWTTFTTQRSAALYKELKSIPLVSRRLAAEWRSMTPEQKKPFQDECDARRAKYAAELAAKPKRPLTTYMSFITKERALLPHANTPQESQQQIKQLAQRWRQLTPQDKARYAPSPSVLAAYARAKEQYDAKHKQQLQQYIQQKQQQKASGSTSHANN